MAQTKKNVSSFMDDLMGKEIEGIVDTTPPTIPTLKDLDITVERSSGGRLGPDGKAAITGATLAMTLAGLYASVRVVEVEHEGVARLVVQRDKPRRHSMSEPPPGWKGPPPVKKVVAPYAPSAMVKVGLDGTPGHTKLLVQVPTGVASTADDQSTTLNDAILRAVLKIQGRELIDSLAEKKFLITKEDPEDATKKVSYLNLPMKGTLLCFVPLGFVKNEETKKDRYTFVPDLGGSHWSFVPAQSTCTVVVYDRMGAESSTNRANFKGYPMNKRSRKVIDGIFEQVYAHEKWAEIQALEIAPPQQRLERTTQSQGQKTLEQQKPRNPLAEIIAEEPTAASPTGKVEEIVKSSDI